MSVRRVCFFLRFIQVKLTTNNKKEGFPITALRETNVLLSLHNPNIVRVLEMVIGSSLDKVYMVMEYFDHDLKSVMRHMRHQKVSRQRHVAAAGGVGPCGCHDVLVRVPPGRL